MKNIPLSGAITAANINDTLGVSTSTQRSLNDAAVRLLNNTTAGTGTSFNALRGTAQWRTTTSLRNNWTWSGSGVNRNFSAFSGTTYIAMNNRGVLITNTALTGAWTLNTNLVTQLSMIEAYGITYGNGRFLVFYAGSDNLIRCGQSTDQGITWTENTSFRTNINLNPNETIWTGSEFICALNQGYIARSTDGVTWSLITTLRATTWGTVFSCNGIAHNSAGTIMVVGGGNAANARCATSTDGGQNWTFRAALGTANTGITAFTPRFVAHQGGTWAVASTAGGTNTSNNRVYTSTDTGGTFTARTNAYPTSSFPIGMVSNGTNFIISCSNARYSYSSNGSAWTLPASGTAGFNAGSIVFLNSQTIIFRGNGLVFGNVNPPTTWTDVTPLNSSTGGWNGSNFNAILSNGTTILAANSSSQRYTSTTGTSWTYSDSPIVYPQATQGSNFIGFNTNAFNYAYSSDGITWTTPGAPNEAASYAYDFFYSQICAWDGNTTWVGLAASSQQGGYSTNNTVSWTQIANFPAAAPCVAYGLGRFVFVATNFTNNFFGYLNTSVSPWAYVPVTVTTTTFYSTNSNIVFGNSRFVKGGVNGKTVVSTDGTSWTEYTALNGMTGWGTQGINSLTFDGTNFVASGETGGIGISNDGITWFVQPMAQTSTVVANQAIKIGANSTVGFVGAPGGFAAISP